MKFNTSENEEEMKYEEFFCSTDLAGENDAIVVTVSVNIFLSITAVLGNALILVALQRESSLHPPSKLLFRSLATTDLCVGLVSEPMAVIHWMSLIYDPWNICRNVFVSKVVVSYVLCGMSLLTMTAISVDRLLALLLGLKYRQVVTIRRTCILVTALWVKSIIFSTIYVKNNQVAITYVHVITSLCLTTSTVSYTTIFVKLRCRRNRGNAVECWAPKLDSNYFNMARFKKAVSSALWLQMTLIVCYLPSGVVIFWSTETSVSSSLVTASRITTTLVFLNSSLNPILFCWKMKEIRQAVKTILGKLCCS
ncbi:melanocortin receptor 3-like [Montipora foliosa]|uniref:melanocortin receptor 3-like n=1 Tax=Montipora foliosa TaxID=591990 RepID=UPI0035F20349